MMQNKGSAMVLLHIGAAKQGLQVALKQHFLITDDSGRTLVNFIVQHSKIFISTFHFPQN